MISYRNAIDPDFGKYTIKNDIIITPFWTKKFCADLVDLCDQYRDRFLVREPEYGTNELSIHDLSRLLLSDYANHFGDSVLPMLRKEWLINTVHGIFSPYILRYDMLGKKNLQIHTDVGLFTTYIRLNDDYKGCHVTFPRQNFSVEHVPVGHAIFWPSMISHPHYVTDLIEGVKYTFTSFMWPPEWSDQTGFRFQGGR